MFKLGEVKLPSDDDFEYVKQLCEGEQGWNLEYNKSAAKVWRRPVDQSGIHMVKTRADYDDVSADLLYRMFQDNDYRAEFDEKMLESYEICYISPCSDIGYYSFKSPRPFKNRDFVTQRCWLDMGANREKIIYNHSVDHAKQPIKKNFIRGLSYMTATYIKPTGPKSCQFFYITQADPCGSLPSWIVNKGTTVMAPKFIKKAHKAALKYDKWKAKHNPTYQPWINPEQIRVPKIDWNDIRQLDRGALMAAQEIPNEAAINENETDKSEMNDDE